jgi:hypothetical protein
LNLQCFVKFIGEKYNFFFNFLIELTHTIIAALPSLQRNHHCGASRNLLLIGGNPLLIGDSDFRQNGDYALPSLQRYHHCGKQNRSVREDKLIAATHAKARTFPAIARAVVVAIGHTARANALKQRKHLKIEICSENHYLCLCVLFVICLLAFRTLNPSVQGIFYM